jgi:hypothetical protein
MLHLVDDKSKDEEGSGGELQKQALSGGRKLLL